MIKKIRSGTVWEEVNDHIKNISDWSTSGNHSKQIGYETTLAGILKTVTNFLRASDPSVVRNLPKPRRVDFAQRVHMFMYRAKLETDRA